MEKNQCGEIIDDLELHLQSCGWQADHVQLVVDNIVETFKNNLPNDFYNNYDDIARNCGIAETQPFDDKANSLIDKVNECLKKE